MLENLNKKKTEQYDSVCLHIDMVFYKEEFGSVSYKEQSTFMYRRVESCDSGVLKTMCNSFVVCEN